MFDGRIEDSFQVVHLLDYILQMQVLQVALHVEMDALDSLESMLVEQAVQVTFLKNGTKSLPKLTSENLKNKRLEDGCIAESHF